MIRLTEHEQDTAWKCASHRELSHLLFAAD